MYPATVLSIAALGAVASAFDLPDNLKQIYDNHRSGTCQNPLSDVFPEGAVYCGDIPNAIFLKGASGNYDNMDIDCDGANDKAGGCSNDPSGQGETSFKSTVKNFGIEDLDANVHPYVVFGNEGATPSFSPEKFEMQPLSVMAVVCNNQVFYGIWGDTNGFTSTGEAAISMGNLCFPNDHLNGNQGHDPLDILYIGFKGQQAVPGADANWTAGNTADFESSIKNLGDSLVASLQV